MTDPSRPDTPLTWITLHEAQGLMGRCESTARRLIRKHGVRTKRVLVERGQELRVCLEDIMNLLPDEAPIPQHLTRAVVPRPSGTPGDGRLPAPIAPEVDDIFMEFQTAIRALAQASSAQVEVVEKLGAHLDSGTRERSEIGEGQRQLSDSLANINRTSKSQAAALMEFGHQLKEQKTPFPRAWFLAAALVGVVIAALAGAGTTYFILGLNRPEFLGGKGTGGPGSGPDNPASTAETNTDDLEGGPTGSDEAALRQAIREELQQESERRIQYFGKIESRLEALEASTRGGGPAPGPEAEDASGGKAEPVPLPPVTADVRERQPANTDSTDTQD